MNSKKYLLLSMLFCLITLGFIPSISATTSQWFPTEGTISEFQLSHHVNFLNGTSFTTNIFDLYATAGYFTIIPSMNKHYFSEPAALGISILNDTEIFYRYTYTELSETQWKRSKSFHWGNGTIISDKQLDVFSIYETSTFSYKSMVGTYDTVDKINFFTSYAQEAFLDYFDCSIGLGGVVNPDAYYVISISSESIVAHREAGYFNHTYIAQSNGRVTMYSRYFSSPSLLSTGALSVGIIYNLISSDSSGIPSFSMLFTVFSFLLGFALIKIGIRCKTYL